MKPRPWLPRMGACIVARAAAPWWATSLLGFGSLIRTPQGSMPEPERISKCLYRLDMTPTPSQTPTMGSMPHGVETRAGARILHISGQVGVSPEGHLPADFHGQCRQALANLESVLQAANMELMDIVKMSFFLVRREDMSGLVEVRKELLDGVRPAITTVFVAGLVSPDWRVEVEAVACAE